MRVSKAWRCASALLAVALMFFALPVRAAITPESDVVLPWFEVDLNRQEVGLATTFTVVNATPNIVTATYTVYTNWGIPVLEVPVEFDRTESHTFNLHEWILHGRLPHRQMTPAELADLQAKLTGKPSPVDGLYYGTAFEHEPQRAVGYVVIRATGNNRLDALWGDTYNVDVANDYFAGETLNALTHDLKADCSHHGIRFSNEGPLFEGTELVIWSGRSFQPSPTPNPIGERMKITLNIFDQTGAWVQTCERYLLAVEPLEVCHLDITPPVGWLEIVSEDPTFIQEHLHSVTQASAALHSYCLRAEAKVDGPSITIEKKVVGHEADQPPGPSIEIGNPIEFQYVVTNTGTTTLTSVTVVDDTGLDVTCPKKVLNAGESMTCTATSIAQPCLNVNIGAVTASAPGGKNVGATDAANYTGIYKAALSLELLVNDLEADTPTGPTVPGGDPLHWTFVVTNTGTTKLTDVGVKNQNNQPGDCPKNELAPGESMICTAETLALEGQQHEVGTATADDPCNAVVVATDPAYYFGRVNRASITIEKYVNENDADTPPGPTIPIGTTIQWRYVVTNSGNVTLNNVSVTDNVTSITPQCPKSSLEPGESMICTATSFALACLQTNIGTATGTPAEGPQTPVSAQDPANYTGSVRAAVGLKLSVNGDPADTPPGPWVDNGSTVLFTFEVVNIGNVTLTDLVVSDEFDNIVSCPKTSLAAGETMTCTATVLAVPGTHEVTGQVTGRGPCGWTAESTNPAHYRVRSPDPDIDLRKLLNGEASHDTPGPSIPMGTTVYFAYVVTNTGNVPLTGITVTDDTGIAVTCPKTALEPGESMTCTASTIATPCSYLNRATATGRPPSGEPVHDEDFAVFYGEIHPALTIDKRLNGEDAPQAPGPVVTTGSALSWTFVVTNTGDIKLTDVKVVDDRLGDVVSCPKSALEPGESMTCTARGTAISGQQQNVATVTGKPPCGDLARATDTSYYRGVTPGIAIEKLINGEDADDATHALNIITGSQILWSFVVTNIGDVVLNDVSVSDPPRTVTCPKDTLQPGESMTCTAIGVAATGMNCNTAQATGTSPQKVTVTDTDSACYTGVTSGISLEKLTNGSEADTPTGPQIKVGDPVQWTYVVTNTGDLKLTNVIVTDNRGVTVTCPKTSLDPGESMTCTASGTATLGQYSNLGTATGTPEGGTAISVTDPSHYIGYTVADQGCTPGYWKNHTGSWPPTGYSPSQSVLTLFSNSSAWPPLAASSLLDALGFAGGPGVEGAAEILLRAAVAAVLNAAHPGVTYPRTEASVLADVNTALGSNNRDTMLALAAALDADNNRGCPLN